MGTSETSMAYIRDEIGRAVGLPSVLGGVPLDELGATGFGLAVCADVLGEAKLLDLGGARVVIQGFGAVGWHAARLLDERGATIIAVSDSQGATWNPAGLDVASLRVHKKSAGSVSGFPGGTAVPRDDVIGFECELLVPAAQPDVITTDNAAKISAGVILEGANIPLRSRPKPTSPSVACCASLTWWLIRVASSAPRLNIAAPGTPKRSPKSRRRSATPRPSCWTVSGTAR